MNYHVRIYQKEKSSEWIFDLTKDKLIELVVNPYQSGFNLFLNGTTVEIEGIESLEIRQTQNSIEQIVDEIRSRKNTAKRPQADAGSPVIVTKAEAYMNTIISLESNIRLN